MFEVGQPQGNHNGANLAFGPDGCLYAGFGDGGNGGDTGPGPGHKPTIGNGQDKATQLGKVLRFDVDNPTTNAPGNMAGAADHIWSMGVRNPWRFSFDRETGDMYICEVGQGTWEEVDVEPKGVGGRNYGGDTAVANGTVACSAA